MRFVWAVAAFVLAAVMIGAGIAQRTVFEGPKTQTTSISVDQDAPYVLVEGPVLTSEAGAQTLRASGQGTIFAAYGRTADLEAWLSDSTYNDVTVNGSGKVTTKLVTPADAATTDGATPAPTPAATEDPAAAAPGRNPAGSDLWLDEFQEDDLLIAPLKLPDTMSVIIATDGTKPAPTAISVSWPIQNATPWAGPLIVGGAILMAIGITLYILGIRHARRSRGPRRKGLPLPVTEPIDLAVEGQDKGVISASGRTRRALSGGRRSLIVIPAVAVSALLFTGCSADAWPDLAGSPTPTPTASVIVPEGQQAPAVTEAQAERILVEHLQARSPMPIRSSTPRWRRPASTARRSRSGRRTTSCARRSPTTRRPRRSRPSRCRSCCRRRSTDGRARSWPSSPTPRTRPRASCS